MISIVKFGSCVRGESDIASDKDVMLIYNNHKVFDVVQCRNKLETQGFSVRTMPLNMAIYNSKRGDLFIKHVINEGKIYSGDRGVISLVSSFWEPKNSYRDEILDSTNLLEILGKTYRNIHGALAANDLLIVVIRNIIIRRLAEYGCYLYSWKRLGIAALSYGIINYDITGTILRSRMIKNLYRAQKFVLVDEGFLIDLCSIVRDITRKNVVIRYSNRGNISKNDFLYSRDNYIKLRALEMLRASYDSDSRSPELNQILFFLKNYSYFSYKENILSRSKKSSVLLTG